MREPRRGALGFGGSSAARGQDTGPDSDRRLREPDRGVLGSLIGASTDWSAFAWVFLQKGVEIYEVHASAENGPAAALLRYAGGARVDCHRHLDWEYTLVLEGSLSDDTAEYRTGDLVFNGPNSEHRVASSNGCVVLTIRTGPVASVGSRATPLSRRH